VLKRNVLELTVKHVDSLTLIGWCRPTANVTLKAHSAHSNRLLNTPVARLTGTLMPAKDPWTARDRRLRKPKFLGSEEAWLHENRRANRWLQFLSGPFCYQGTSNKWLPRKKTPWTGMLVRRVTGWMITGLHRIGITMKCWIVAKKPAMTMTDDLDESSLMPAKDPRTATDRR